MADPGPLFLNRPRAVTAYTNKYAPGSALQSFLSTLYPQTRTALQTFDAARANVGRPPLTKEETRFAGTAVNEQRAVAPEPDQPFWRDAISDVRTVLNEVPKLPVTLFKEGQAVTQLPQAVQELPEASNPLEQIGNVAQLPGIRMIPGSFVASQFGTGGQGVGGLTEHPVLTALDVLPYASKAARLTKTAQLAEDVAQRAAAAEGGLPRRTSPFSALIRNARVGGPVETLRPSPIAPNIEIPALEPNVVGRALEATGATLRRTGAGNVAQQAFGKLAREDARVRNRISGDVQVTTADNPLPAFRDDLSRTAATARDEAARLAELRSTLDSPERAATVEQIGRVGDPAQLRTLTTAELEYLDTARKLNEPLRSELVKEGQLAEREVGGVTETYDTRTATRLDQVRHARDAQLAAQHLRETLDERSPTTMTRDEAIMNLDTLFLDRRIKGPTRELLTRGYLRTLENMGYDVRQARKLMGDRRWNQITQSIPSTPTRPASYTPGTKRNLQAIQRAGFRDGKLNQALRIVEKAENRAVPARLEEAVRTRFDEVLTNELNARYSGPDLDRALDLVSRRMYPDLEQYIPEIRKLRNEVRDSWQELRAQGFDPVFQHRVHPSQAGRYDFPKIVDYVPTLSQTKARLWDAQPIVSDYAVSLNDRALEILVKRGREAYVNDFLTPRMARTTLDLNAQYLPAAQRAGVDVETLIRKDWAPYNPNSFINGRANVQTLGGAPKYWIPRDLAKNLERLQVGPGEIARLMDKPMKLFRTSVLPLSPRWHIYNLLGNSILLLARSRNPLTVARFFNKARMLMKEGGVEGLAQNPALSIAEQEAARLAPAQGTRAGLEWFKGDELPKGDMGKLSAAFHTTGGAQASAWLKQAWEAGATKGLRKGFNWVTAKSYWANQWLDDFARSVRYFEEYENAIKKGANGEQALRQGIAATRESFQNWDTMTPIERSVLRYIFPFYSWTRTVLRYTLTYPVDHPWRTSILANMANAELNDFNSGLPSRLQNLLFLGNPDSDGNVTAINLDGANPFRDVANYFSLAGFLSGDGDLGAVTSQLNPFASTALQWAGVDTTRGIPELYPELKFNPDTGTVDPIPSGNPLQTAIGNFLPQSRALTSVLGWNTEFRQLAQQDPKAAGRFLASAIGVPAMRRDVNVPRETINAELTRYHALRDDVNASLKAGNLQGLTSRYPALDAFAARIQSLPTKQLVKYQAQPGLHGSLQPGVSELFQQAVSAGIPRP